MIWINGRRYGFRGVYGNWQEAALKGKTIKKSAKKRWYIKKLQIGYALYVQL